MHLVIEVKKQEWSEPSFAAYIQAYLLLICQDEDKVPPFDVPT